MGSRNSLEISDWRFPNDTSEEDRLIALGFIKDLPDSIPNPDIIPEHNITFKWRMYKSEVILELPEGKVMVAVIRWIDPMDYFKDYIDMKLEDPRCTPQFVRAKIMEAINTEETFNYELADEYRNQAQMEDMP